MGDSKMQIGFVKPNHTVKCGELSGKFLRMSGPDAIVELTDGRRVAWSGTTEVEVLSEVEEIQENWLPTLEAELERLKQFTVGKYATLGILPEGLCIELPKTLHSVFIKAALGERPEDAVVCRRCNNKLCIRGNHLFWGTRSDCQRDMCLKGIARPSGKKVTAADIALRIVRLHTRVQKLKLQLVS